MMGFKTEVFDNDFPELEIIYPTEVFEVDGIKYVAPWLRDNEKEPSVNYQPMIDFKEEYYAPPEHWIHL